MPNEARLAQTRSLGLVSYKMAPNVTIHKHNAVVLKNDGLAYPATAEPGLTYVGPARETYTSTVGGNELVTVIRHDAIIYDNDAAALLTNADVGSKAFIKDGTTVSADGTGRSESGTVVSVEPSGVWIEV